MTALWMAAVVLVGTALALIAWSIANRQRRWRAFAGVVGAFIATVGLAYVVYAMIMFCEAPPGSACM